MLTSHFVMLRESLNIQAIQVKMEKDLLHTLGKK